MFTLSQGKRPIVEESQKISAAICVRNYLLQRPKPIISEDISLSSEEGVKKLIDEIESGSTVNLSKKVNGKMEYSEPNRLRLTYTKSNLGKGFIFWFICNLCGRRVKYLYFPPNSSILACRSCHRLTYDKQNESQRFRPLRRLFGV